MSVIQEPAWRSRRRQKILAAAADLFARSAYDAVQMDDIAHAADVGKPTLYRYFPSKDELFLTVFDEALEQLEAQLAAALEAGLPPRETLALMIRALVGALSGKVATLRMLTGEHSPLAERWRTVFRQRRRPILLALRRALERGVAAGDFRPVDLDATPAMVMGLVRGGLVGAGEVPTAKLADAAIDLMMHGLCAPSVP